MVTKYRDGGGGKFYPYKKGEGAEKISAMLKGGTTSFEVVLTRELEVLAILKGGAKSFHPLKGGGGGAKSFTLS